MPTIRELTALAAPHSVTLLAPDTLHDASTHRVRRVIILQDLTMLRQLPEHSLVIVPSGLFARQDSSGVDLLIKRAYERGVTAVLLQGLMQAQPHLHRLARRYGIVVLGCPGAVDLGELVTTLSTDVTGGPADALSRISLALRRIEAWEEGGDGDPAALTAEVGELVHEPLMFGDSPELGTAVTVADSVIGYVGTGNDSLPTIEAQLVLPALTSAIAGHHRVMNRQEIALGEERSRALTALIVADATSVEHYAALARGLDIDVDGFHTALALRSALEDPAARDLEFRQARSALERVFSGTRYRSLPTRVETDLGLVVSGADGRQLTPNELVPGIQQAMHEAGSPTLFWGVGTEHIGAAGIRASMHEARSAANSAVAERNPLRVVHFDASGIQRLISEVRSSVTAGRIAAELLAPLEDMRTRRALLETLNAWLEEQGSYKAAAARLHLHANSVAYRIGKAASILNLDLSDPDTRLSLQVACRVALHRPQ